MEDTEPLSQGYPAVVMWDTEPLSWGHTAAMRAHLPLLKGTSALVKSRSVVKLTTLGAFSVSEREFGGTDNLEDQS